MNFENLLNNFDMGVCVDQLQREALVDLVLLFVEIDGVVEDKEMQYTFDWVSSIKWDNPTSPVNYVKENLLTARAAIEAGEIEDFIRHRCKHIIDSPAKSLAVELAKGVSMSDGHLDSSEAKAIDFLTECVA